MERSAAIRKIEQDMTELGRLYQEVAELVHQQDPAVEQINQDAEGVADNVRQANTQISQAIDSARRARKWKWYALLIVSKSIHPQQCGYEAMANRCSSYHRHRRRCRCRCHPSQQILEPNTIHRSPVLRFPLLVLFVFLVSAPRSE